MIQEGRFYSSASICRDCRSEQFHDQTHKMVSRMQGKLGLGCMGRLCDPPKWKFYGPVGYLPVWVTGGECPLAWHDYLGSVISVQALGL